MVDLRWSQGQPAGVGVYIRELALALNEHLPVLGLVKKGADLQAPFPVETLPDVPNFRFDVVESILARRRGLPLITLSRLPVLLARRHAFPIVLDLTPLLLPASHPAMRGALERQTYSVVARAGTIITLSETSRRDLTDRLRIPASKICVVVPALSRTIAPPSPVERLRELGISRPYVLAVGTLEPRKNLPVLIDAFSGPLNDVPLQLVFAGGLGWKYRALLEKMAPLQRDGRLIYAGYVSESDKALLYRNALCLAYPSLYEGFGLPILEAMAAGTPAIVSNAPACIEVTGSAGIVLDPGDVAAWAAAIRRVASDDEWRAELSRAGMERATRFSWARSVLPLVQRLTGTRQQAVAA